MQLAVDDVLSCFTIERWVAKEIESPRFRGQTASHLSCATSTFWYRTGLRTLTRQGYRRLAASLKAFLWPFECQTTTFRFKMAHGFFLCSEDRNQLGDKDNVPMDRAILID